MPVYEFVLNDARDYFDPAIGRVEPGERREFETPPDGHWRLVPVRRGAKSAAASGSATSTSAAEPDAEA